MRQHLIIAVFLVAAPALAEDPQPVPPAQPDPEFLEFLGEIGGETPQLILFMSTPEAQQALEDATKEKSKEDHDE
jgi:hypothetical protein